MLWLFNLHCEYSFLNKTQFNYSLPENDSDFFITFVMHPNCGWHTLIMCKCVVSGTHTVWPALMINNEKYCTWSSHVFKLNGIILSSWANAWIVKLKKDLPSSPSLDPWSLMSSSPTSTICSLFRQLSSLHLRSLSLISVNDRKGLQSFC